MNSKPCLNEQKCQIYAQYGFLHVGNCCLYSSKFINGHSMSGIHVQSKFVEGQQFRVLLYLEFFENFRNFVVQKSYIIFVGLG